MTTVAQQRWLGGERRAKEIRFGEFVYSSEATSVESVSLMTKCSLATTGMN